MPGQLMGMLLIPWLLIAVVAALVRRRRTGLDPVAASARRRARVVTVAVLASAVLVLSLPLPANHYVRLSALSALAAAVGALTTGIGELFAPRPSGRVRVADLGARRRSSSKGLPRWYAYGLGLSVVSLAVGVATGTVSPETIQRVSIAPYDTFAQEWPGALLALPVGGALALLAGVTWWSLRRVEARPAIEGRPELDRALRDGSRVRVLRWSATGALLTGSGLAFKLGGGLNQIAQKARIDLDAPRAPWDWTQNIGFTLSALALVAFVAAFLAPFAAGAEISGAANPSAPKGGGSPDAAEPQRHPSHPDQAAGAPADAGGVPRPAAGTSG